MGGALSNVRVYEWPLWFTAAGRTEAVVAWRDGLRVRDVVPYKVHGNDGLWVSLSGSSVDLDHPVSSGESVHYGLRPHSPLPFIFAGPIAAGVPGLAAGGKGIGIGSLLLQATFSMGVSLLIGLLLGSPRGPRKRGDEESATYGFSGLRNDRVEGQPRQVTYGYMRVAPQILDEFTETQNIPSETTLFMLCGLGEGPLYSIGDQTTDTDPATPLSAEDPAHPLPTGMQLNGNALENFDGVEVQVRMGNNAQKWIPGFNYTATAYSVDAELTQEESDAAGGALGLSNDALNPDINLTTVATDYNSDDAAAQAVWDEHGVAQDLASACDSVTALVDFQAGLYGISGTTGAVKDAAFRMLMRYIELDGGGSPITTGGDNGDGWVYVPPTGYLISHQQSRFQREYSTILYDPQTYAPPTRGYQLDCSTASDYAATVTTASMFGLPSHMAVGATLTGMAIELWIKAGTGTTFNSTVGTETYYVFSWGGLEFVFRKYSVFGGAWKWKPTIIMSGTDLLGTQASANSGFVPSSVTSQWTHFVFNYTRVTSSAYRMEVYADGGLLLSRAANFGSFTSPADTMEFFRNNGSTTTPFYGDELRIHSRALTEAEVSSSYNSGKGTYGDSTQASLVDGWHCDLASNPGTDTITVGYKASNQLTASGGGHVGVAAGSGHVFTNPTGTVKRIRPRFECLRINLDSTSQFVQDTATLTVVYGKLDMKLAYPNTPVVGLKVKASEQINSQVPTFTALVKGRTCPIFDGASVSYDWTRNPAWIACDILLNKRYGAGSSHEEQDIDWVSAKEWADYCDGLIYDGTGNVQDIDSGSASDIADIKYDSTLFSSFGGLEVTFWPGEAPPTRWIVGAYVGFAGLPFIGSIAVDINYTNVDVPGGWEIGTISYDSGTDQYTVSLRYDAATYGAPWTDGQQYSTIINPTAVTGTAELREPRFQFDGTMDTFRSVWDTLIEVCSTGRAIPIQEGKRIRFKHERARDPITVIGHAQIKQDTFEMEYVDRLDIANSYAVEFTDRDQNFARSVVNVDDPLLETTASTDDLRRENISLPGITRRSQAIRDALYRLKVNRLVKKRGSFEAGPETLPLEPGDVFVLSHDIVPWGKSGRVASAGATTIVLDREVVLAAATTYYVRVRVSAIGQTGTGSTTSDYMETVTVGSAAGTYAAGASITVSAFATEPSKDDPYVLYSAAEVFLAQVTSTSLSPDLSRKVEWVQYDADVYDVDTLGTDMPASVSLLTTAPTSERTIPGPVLNLTVKEASRLNSAGQPEPGIAVSWDLPEDSRPYIAESRIFTRLAEGEWQLVGSVRGQATSATVPAPSAEAGSEVDVAVQPVTRAGAHRTVRICAKTRMLLTMATAAPEAPSALSAALGTDGATYAWDAPSVSAGLSHEVRRGGWILGQSVLQAPPGMSAVGPTSNWASGLTNANSDPVGRLYLRSRDGRGRYSSAVTLDGFETAVDRATVLESFVWEDYGSEGGFYDTGTPGGGGVSGLTRTTINGRVCLTFTGSSLTGTYTTGSTTISLKASQPLAERMYVEAWAESYQEHPTLFADIPGVGLPESAQWSPEGPLVLLPGQSQCTMTIQIRLTVDGVSGSWIDYVPGVYVAQAVDFRVNFTRPDDTYDIRLFQVHTRLQRVPSQRRERSPTKSYANGRITNRG